MGTSTRYQWKHRRHITKPDLGADPDSPKLVKSIRRDADKLCDSMSHEEWRPSVTGPVVASASTATARASMTVGDVIEGRREWPSNDAELAEIVSTVCDGMDGIHDAPVRRALVRTIEQLDVEVQARRSDRLPLNDDLFCLFYQLFHTELLTELILHFMCEAALPGASTAIMQTELGRWAAERVARLLPNPCKEPNPKQISAPVRGAQFASRAIKNLIEGRETGLEEAA